MAVCLPLGGVVSGKLNGSLALLGLRSRQATHMRYMDASKCMGGYGGLQGLHLPASLQQRLLARACMHAASSTHVALESTRAVDAVL